jgi:hypothetical protein
MSRRTRLLAVLALGAIALGTGVAVAASGASGLTAVPFANPRAAGIAVPTALSPELTQIPLVWGSQPLENGTPSIPYYGYNGDGPHVPAPGAVQTPGTKIEATKTEPDKNTYLVLTGQHGADPAYDYGTHFLFQGHENGLGEITRINLDADAAHRVTLLASAEKNGTPLPKIDGSTWDPWAKRLLFTAESGPVTGGVWQATSDFPSTVEDISGVLGRGGYEGIQNDSAGNLYVIEDVGGAKGTVNSHAKQPNSFVYRFLPTDATDLTKGGKLQALQAVSLQNGQPIAFHAGQADADIISPDQLDLHTYGKTFVTHWVTIHDTAVDGSTPFDANALAKAQSATPFKRPENGQFRPGSSFTELYFDATGDTDSRTEAGSTYGGFGAVFKLTQSPKSNDGQLSLFYRSDVAHSGFDNVAFFSRDLIGFVEDAGDTLHGLRNAFDSAYMFDVRTTPGVPLRFMAQGRDPEATADAALLAAGNGFQNDGDNEITGLHVSDGDPGTGGILGAKEPKPFDPNRKWRVFYTQQHGDNITYEIVRS